jgi:glycosyltransferase 2 family protein
MPIPWRRLLQWAVLVLALAFLFALVRTQSRALADHHWQISPAWAVISLLGLLLTWTWEMATWRTILQSLGGRLTYAQGARAWFLSNIVRYIPGNVWQFLGMAELAAENGVPRLVTLSSIVLHQALSTAAGVVLAALYFALAGQGEWFARLRPFLWAVPLGLLLLQPRLLERVLNWALARAGRSPVVIALTWGQVWLLLMRYWLVWLGLGLSYAALVRSLGPLAPQLVVHLVAVWAAAYTIGYLSMLTPSGLGVREGAMVLLLAGLVAEPVAVVIALVARLWMVAGELLGAALAVAYARYGRRAVQYPVSAQ